MANLANVEINPQVLEAYNDMLAQGVMFGVHKTYHYLRDNYPDVPTTRIQVQALLKAQPENQKRQIPRKPKKVIPLVSTKPLVHLQVDLQDYTNKPSNQFRYLFVVIDTFTRYVWTKKITAKTAVKCRQAFENILGEIEQVIAQQFYSPVRIVQTDQGAEFQGAFTNFLQAKGIRHQISLAYTPESQAIVERANGTLKSIMGSINLLQGGNWGENIELATELYNNSYHSTIKMNPAEALFNLDPNEQDQLKTDLRDKADLFLSKQKVGRVHNYKIGDLVRLRIRKGILAKFSGENFSDEIYMIHKITRPTLKFTQKKYQIKEEDGTIIPSLYFGEDLLKIT